MAPSPDAPTQPTSPPAGAGVLLSRYFWWFAIPCLLLAALGAGIVAMIPHGNDFAIPIILCGILGLVAALFAWVGLNTWLDARREIRAMERGEMLARWNCPEKHWELLDPTWKHGEPLGEICLSPHAIYIGSAKGDALFLEWRSRRQHLTLVELHAGDPSLLRIDIRVPSRGRVAGYTVPVAVPVPLEQRDQVDEAVAALQASDAVRPKGESWIDILLFTTIVVLAIAGIAAKLGFFK